MIVADRNNVPTEQAHKSFFWQSSVGLVATIYAITRSAFAGLRYSWIAETSALGYSVGQPPARPLNFSCRILHDRRPQHPYDGAQVVE